MRTSGTLPALLAAAVIGAACGDETTALEGPDAGPLDGGALQCPERFYKDAGIETARVAYVQFSDAGSLFARLPEFPPDEGVGPVLGCFSGCRIDAQYPIDGGIPDYGPTRSMGRVTVYGASGSTVSTEHPEYSTQVSPGPFADGEGLEFRSVGDPSDAPAMQASLRKPVRIELVAPATDRVSVPAGQGLELRWTRSSTSAVGVVEVRLSGQSRAGAFGDAWQDDFHNAHCTFPVAADRALIPAEVLETYDPSSVSVEIGVVDRARVDMGQGWDAKVEARSFREFLSIDLQ